MSSSDESSALCVVVIDDNRDAADTLVLLLVILGHQATAAYSGQMGLRVCSDISPDLAIIDLDMHELDGCDTLRQLRRNPALSDCYAVCLTGRSTAEAEQRCSDAGFDRFIAKPLSPDDLQTLLDRCIERKRLRLSDRHSRAT